MVTPHGMWDLISQPGIELVPLYWKGRVLTTGPQGKSLWLSWLPHLFDHSVAQSCPTICGPMDCSLSGSSVHGIFQARVLEWIAISFSRGSSRPRNPTQVSRIAGRRFTIWATRESMVFPVVMYGCESWTIKKAECQIIDAFELWCWRRLLRVPWTARRSNLSILKEISPGYSLERC